MPASNRAAHIYVIIAYWFRVARRAIITSPAPVARRTAADRGASARLHFQRRDRAPLEAHRPCASPSSSRLSWRRDGSCSLRIDGRRQLLAAMPISAATLFTSVCLYFYRRLPAPLVSWPARPSQDFGCVASARPANALASHFASP